MMTMGIACGKKIFAVLDTQMHKDTRAREPRDFRRRSESFLHFFLNFAWLAGGVIKRDARARNEFRDLQHYSRRQIAGG